VAADGTPARNWRMPDSPPRTIVPAGTPATPFAGRVVMLIGPQNSSAGFLIAREMKASGAALLIGRPTGGNQRGLNGGQLAWITLPASKVSVDIPLVAHFAPGNPPDAGVLPDIEVKPSFDDAAAGIDGERAEALAQIARWRAATP
jgi:C-terminal processing protease CtpA/Prc